MLFTLRNAAVSLLILLLWSPAHATAFGEPWPLWDAAPARQATDLPAIDHSLWQALLTRYMSTGPDGINRIDYPGLARQGRAELDRYLAQLQEIDPRQHRRPEQMAYWINLYNALTVRVVLANPGRTSIRRMGQGLFSFGPWDDEVATVAGQALTLNDIEHRILRPIWRDARIHFAVNCASLGCPDLSANAYTASNLEQLLNDAQARYINHPRGVRLSTSLQLSSIFKWYREDFAPDEAALLRYLATHHEAGTRLAAFQGRISYNYDWSLNGPPLPATD